MDLVGKFQIGCILVLVVFFVIGVLSVWVLFVWSLTGYGLNSGVHLVPTGPIMVLWMHHNGTAPTTAPGRP